MDLPSKTESSRSKMYRDFKIKEGYIILHVLSLQKTFNKSMLVLDKDPSVLFHAHLFCHIADLNTYLKKTNKIWLGRWVECGLQVCCKLFFSKFSFLKKKKDWYYSQLNLHPWTTFICPHSFETEKKLDFLKPLTTNKNSILINFLVTSCTWHGGVIRKIVHVGCGLGYFGKPMSWGGGAVACFLSGTPVGWIKYRKSSIIYSKPIWWGS